MPERSWILAFTHAHANKSAKVSLGMMLLGCSATRVHWTLISVAEGLWVGWSSRYWVLAGNSCLNVDPLSMLSPLHTILCFLWE